MKKEMEIWRKFVNETLGSDFINKLDDKVLLESLQTQKSYIYLFEGDDGAPKRVCFEDLAENYKDQDKLYNLWEQSFEYEYQQLLSEGLMDVIASAYESTKSGAIKLKDKISDEALAAMAKVSDFFLEKSIQVYNFAKESPAKVANKVSSLFSAVGKFEEKHPILYKIVVVIGLTIIVYVVVSAVEQLLGGGTASAAIDPAYADQGGLRVVNDRGYEVLRGAIDTMGSSDFDSLELRAKAMKIVDDAYKSKELVDITKIKGEVGEYVKMAFKQVNSAYQIAQDASDPRAAEAKNYMLRLYKVGYNTVYELNGALTRVAHEKGSMPTFGK